jgi:hypothetical protein
MQARTIRATLALAVLLSVAAISVAGEAATLTLTGQISCAKCNLKKAKECQDVLVVTGEDAGEYYLVKNDALEKFGHTCKGQRAAKVTGIVSDKNGQKWLEATSIEATS